MYTDLEFSLLLIDVILHTAIAISLFPTVSKSLGFLFVSKLKKLFIHLFEIVIMGGITACVSEKKKHSVSGCIFLFCICQFKTVHTEIFNIVVII